MQCGMFGPLVLNGAKTILRNRANCLYINNAVLHLNFKIFLSCLFRLSTTFKNLVVNCQLSFELCVNEALKQYNLIDSREWKILPHGKKIRLTHKFPLWTPLKCSGSIFLWEWFYNWIILGGSPQVKWAISVRRLWIIKRVSYWKMINVDAAGGMRVQPTGIQQKHWFVWTVNLSPPAGNIVHLSVGEISVCNAIERKLQEPPGPRVH